VGGFSYYEAQTLRGPTFVKDIFMDPLNRDEEELVKKVVRILNWLLDNMYNVVAIFQRLTGKGK
jgi:hypothetical protein